MENDKRKYPGRPDQEALTPGNAPNVSSDSPPDRPGLKPDAKTLVATTMPVDGSGPLDESAIHDDPPSKEAIEEKNDRPAANLIMWAILIAVIIMAIIYFFVFYDRDTVSALP